jgi:hypothetical protein
VTGNRSLEGDEFLPLIAPAPTPHLLEMLRLLDDVNRYTRQTMLVPPGLLDCIEDPRPGTTSILNGMALSMRDFAGMRVQAHPLLADFNLPMRRHRKRRWMSEAYHRRIQKKWTKRFGVGPAAFVINDRFMHEGIGNGNAVAVLP